VSPRSNHSHLVPTRFVGVICLSLILAACGSSSSSAPSASPAQGSSSASPAQGSSSASPAQGSSSASPAQGSSSASPAQGSSSAAPAADVTQELIVGDTLTVGQTVDPPFVIRTTNGQWDSLSPALATKFAAYLGKKLEIVTTSFTTGVAGLQARKFDMLGSDWHATAQRKAVVNFCTPFTVSGTSYFVNRDDPQHPTTMDGLNSPAVSIVLITGSDNQTTTEQYLPKAKEVLLPSATVPDLILQLQSHRVTALGTSTYLVPAMAKQYPQFVAIPDDNIGVLSQGAGWAFNQNATALLQACNAFMAMETQNGDLAALTKQYITLENALAPANP
jgi:ABC-type amino acid transport substrate-binding protein